jgi:hypothetical protein
LLKLFLVLNLLLLNLYACKGGYDSCKRKIIDSQTIQNQNLIIPISKKQKLVFASDISTLNENIKIIKQDLFLSLYLVEGSKSFRYPFKLNKHHSLGVAAVNKTMSLEGKITSRQIGLNKFAIFDDVLFSPSLLITSCCSLEGIVTPRGIIEKEYIKRFLNSKRSDYSDIGIRVRDIGSKVTVIASDPFKKNNLLNKDDIILEYDGKKVKKSSHLMKKILFSKVGTTHNIKINRNNQIWNFKVTTTKRYGGGYISDTFLEQKGIYFDTDLQIIKIEKRVKEYGLRVGDKLLQANGFKINNQQELLENIANFKYFSSLLFERNHFQFFVQIN